MTEANKQKQRKTSIGVWIATRVIRLYQIAISPMLGPRCRFYPTCSSYALEALKTHGFLKGCWLAVCRICKCHPFHPGGVDFVPCSKEEKEKHSIHDAA